MSHGEVQVNVAGTIERVLYKSSESGYAAMKLKADDEVVIPYCDHNRCITIVGSISDLGVGQRLSVTGALTPSGIPPPKNVAIHSFRVNIRACDLRYRA